MTDHVKPEDLVIVHHAEIGAIAGDRRQLADLLDRGRALCAEDVLAGDETMREEVLIALLASTSQGMQIDPGTMTWLNPVGVTHTSPASPQLARAVLQSFEKWRLAQSGVEVPTAREAAAARLIPPEYR